MMKILKYLFWFLIGLVVVFFGRGMMTSSVSYDAEITVDKPVEEAWAVMSDEGKMSEWLEGFQKYELISGNRGEVGAVSNVHFMDNDQEVIIEETIKEVKANELMAMQFNMDFMKMDYEMHFKEMNGKTHIKSKTKTTGNGFFAKAMVAWMGGAMTDQEETNMAKLKNLINSNTKDYFPAPVEEVAEEMEASMES